MRIKLKEGVIGNCMCKIKVLQQVLDPSGTGGVSSEFRALKSSALSNKYEFDSMVLMDPHRGINWHDISFYLKSIKESKPDIIHVRGAALDGLNAVIAAKIYGKAKIFVAVHGMYSDIVHINPFKKWISKHIVEGLTFGFADGISCVCRRITDRSYFDKYRSKMLPFVYNRMPCFDTSMVEQDRESVRKEFGIDIKDLVCLFLGRLTIEKGIDDLFAALDSIDLPKNFVLLMVGSGDYFAHCNKIAATKKYRVVMVGSRMDISRFYHSADFFVLPSLHENHSISLLEACAAGLPSVATDCGGNAETIEHNKTGIIVPVGDVNKLAFALNRMLDSKCRNMFVDNLLKDNFSRFSNEECDKALDSAYQSLLTKSL